MKQRFWAHWIWYSAWFSNLYYKNYT